MRLPRPASGPPKSSAASPRVLISSERGARGGASSAGAGGGASVPPPLRLDRARRPRGAAGAGGRLVAELVVDPDVPRLVQEDRADDERHERDDDRVPEAGVDVARP